MHLFSCPRVAAFVVLGCALAQPRVPLAPRRVGVPVGLMARLVEDLAAVVYRGDRYAEYAIARARAEAWRRETAPKVF